MHTIQKTAKMETCKIDWRDIYFPPVNLYTVAKLEKNMEHPLLGKLSELSNEEVQAKHSELTTKLNRAYGMGNPEVIRQLQMMLESYSNELNTRHRKMMDELAGKDDKWKDLIDISKKR